VLYNKLYNKSATNRKSTAAPQQVVQHKVHKHRRPQEVHNILTCQHVVGYSLLYDLSSNKSTTNRSSGIWALFVIFAKEGSLSVCQLDYSKPYEQTKFYAVAIRILVTIRFVIRIQGSLNCPKLQPQLESNPEFSRWFKVVSKTMIASSDIQVVRNCVTCNAEFTGHTCETPLELCNVSICENGATCFLSLDGSAQCACAAGYDGPTCSHQVRPYDVDAEVFVK